MFERLLSSDRQIGEESGQTHNVSPLTSHSSLQLKQRLRGLSFAEQEALLSPNADIQAKGHLEGDVQDEAAKGVSGSGGQLPYFEQIQASFGKHDISHIEAHTGDEAAQASKNIGAEAYARGSDIAFSGAPSLHTAAHEAAHVIQQQGGVSLKGGVGEAGDSYEQHADAVADLVVQGKSAEGLLDKYAGGGQSSGVQKTEVQRKEAQKLEEDKTDWANAKKKTAFSFTDLLLSNKDAAYRWEDNASAEDPPPLWQQALTDVGGLVFSAALGGVGAALVTKLVGPTAKFIAEAAINAAVDFGKNGIENATKSGLNAIVATDKDAALTAYCKQQQELLIDAAAEARDNFINNSGSRDKQELSIEEMNEIAQANRELRGKAESIQNHEMLLGWMMLLAGDTGPNKAITDVQGLKDKGILRIIINGVMDSPVSIIDAKVSGLNEFLRASLEGKSLGDCLHSAERDLGLDILVTTGNPTDYSKNFSLKESTHNEAVEAGTSPRSTNWLTMTATSKNRAVWFSFFIEQSGTYSWIDSDRNWALDYGSGADAGRWFLDNKKSAFQILRELHSAKIPKVGK